MTALTIRRKFARASLIVVVTVLSESIWAHHSTSLFDPTKRVTLSGTVSSVFWGNPHIYINLEVDGAGGQAHWSVISGTPSLNVRNGWKYDDVKVGDKVTVIVNPARDGRQEGILDEITLADGRTIGGPRDFLKKPSENP
ncbi:MAG: DUF6152 family protein [Steroidobacteraceae bacterium]|jgi:hypothetical protein